MGVGQNGDTVINEQQKGLATMRYCKAVNFLLVFAFMAFTAVPVYAQQVTTELTAKRHHHGDSCDGINKCRCGSTQASYFGYPRMYEGFNLWLASDWPRAFPRASAGAGMVGYQPGHVFRYVGEGSKPGYAIVSDDAGTYERNVRGAIYVDPHGNVASRIESRTRLVHGRGLQQRQAQRPQARDFGLGSS